MMRGMASAVVTVATVVTLLAVVVRDVAGRALVEEFYRRGEYPADECFAGEFGSLVETVDVKFAKRIANGDDIIRKEWPFLTVILEKYEDGGMAQFCGGSLIGPNAVLSAAHCFDDPESPNLVVRFGEHDLLSKAEEHQDRAVTKIIPHELFSWEGDLYDIALLIFEPAVETSQFVQPLCLPPAGLGFEAGDPCVVAGWGVDHNDENTLRAQHVVIPKDHAGTCSDIYGIPIKDVIDTIICAGDPLGRSDSCGGDSGGPLLCYDGAEWNLAGLVSFGGDECATPDMPSVYTNVVSYLDWIADARKQHDPSYMSNAQLNN